MRISHGRDARATKTGPGSALRTSMKALSLRALGASVSHPLAACKNISHRGTGITEGREGKRPMRISHGRDSRATKTGPGSALRACKKALSLRALGASHPQHPCRFDSAGAAGSNPVTSAERERASLPLVSHPCNSPNPLVRGNLFLTLSQLVARAEPGSEPPLR